MLLCSIYTRGFFSSALLILSVLSLDAQELFPLNQPASVVPKNALGVRLSDIDYKEVDLHRNIVALKVMYGLTPKLTVALSTVVSNYHQKDLPFDFVTHCHTCTVPTGSETPVQKGIEYPYIFDGVDVYAQYRFFSSDGKNQHLRMAAYGEASYIDIQSHLAEPILEDHNTGIGAGIITTYLVKHFAASFTGGFIIPKAFKGNTYDQYGGVYPTILIYPDAVNYNLSFGYLLYPQHYSNYNETNWNIYMEFTGKTYGQAIVRQVESPFAPFNNYITFPDTNPALQRGSYIEADPGVQCILRSDIRIECSVSFPLVNQSYLHEYPLYIVGVQKYFFFNKKIDKD
jgi:hypothetical protein